MSTLENERYLESAQELYESSVADGDTKTAEAVLADLRNVGFTKEAVSLAEKKSVLEIMLDVTDKTVQSSSYHDDVYLPRIAEEYGGV